MSLSSVALRATTGVALSLWVVACSSPESSSRTEVMADYPFYASAEALVEEADLVVIGTAVASREDTSFPSYEGTILRRIRGRGWSRSPPTTSCRLQPFPSR